MALPVNNNISFSKTFTVPHQQLFSQPYWLAQPMNKGSFNIADTMLTGNAQNLPDFTAQFILNIYGEKFIVNRAVQYKYTDPVKGEQYQPLVVIPPVIVSVAPNNIFTHVQPGNEYTAHPFLDIQYKTNFSGKNVPISVLVNAQGYKLSYKDSLLSSQHEELLYKKDTLQNVEAGEIFNVKVPVKNLAISNGSREQIISVNIGIMQIIILHFILII